MSNNLYTINTQLMEIQRLMNYYRLNLGNKEEELSRLNEALIDLVNNKSDFKGTKWICMKPESSPKVLYGENAKTLNNFKQNVLEASFIAIPNEQVTNAEVKIRERIQSIQQEVNNLKSSISSAENRYAQWMTRKREVENQS